VVSKAPMVITKRSSAQSWDKQENSHKELSRNPTNGFIKTIRRLIPCKYKTDLIQKQIHISKPLNTPSKDNKGYVLPPLNQKSREG